MEIEFHYKGESKKTSLLTKCSMHDILSSFAALFLEVKHVENDDNNDNETIGGFDMHLVNDDSSLTLLQTPLQQLCDGAVIDIKEKKAKNENENVKEKENQSEIDNDINNGANKDEISCHIKKEIHLKSEINGDCDTDDHKLPIYDTNNNKETDDGDDNDNDDNNNNNTNNTNNKDDDKQETDEKGARFVIRLRGLPWSARENEITEFFAEESIEEVQIVFLTDGRASGEALVEFVDVQSFQTAFLKNRHHIGHRYIEIFKSTGMEIDTAAGRAVRPPARPPKSQFVIRMRGLPYSATDEDVCEFFNIPKPTQIHLIKDDLGRPSGEGFVEFKTEVDAIAAMAKHRHHMGHRYIELFRSSPEELMRALGLTTGWYNNRNGGPQPKSTCILMRGLPYSCTESDITKFFQEIDVTPIRIHRKADGAEAYVEFYSVSDTDKAMTRHRNYIGRRYIELFRVTYEDMARTVGLPVTNTNIPASALSINPSIMSQQQMIGATSIMSAPLFADTMNTINTMKQGNATTASNTAHIASAHAATAVQIAAAAQVAAITNNTPSLSSAAQSSHSYYTPQHPQHQHHPSHVYHHNQSHGAHASHNHSHAQYPSAAHASHHYAPSASSHSANSHLLLSAANINALMNNPLVNTPNTQTQHVHYATPHSQHSSQPMLNNNINVNHYPPRHQQTSYYQPQQPYY